MERDLELYEILYLVDPNFSEKELDAKINFYRDFLTQLGSQVMLQNRGKRNLSYSIKGFENATYIQMLYVGNQKLVKNLNLALGRDNTILRHLTTKIRNPPQNIY
uniref:ribosomal protein S6 n=1 Tax=Ochrosphaera neapolitana TaxID=35137 RepID=UPI00286A3055|nr:ribosomal protein S6 [Ochrosphaera neapolitana]WKK50165.1 ribosomal protein S6 [Ochrosphaera neapolitana]